MNPSSILIVTFGFEGGLWGSGRLLSDLTRHIDPGRYRVTIFLLTERPVARRELSGGVTLIGGDYFSTWFRKLAGVLAIYRLCREHEFVVSNAELTPTYMTILAAMMAFKRPVGGVHVHLSAIFRYRLRPSIHSRLVPLVYPYLRKTIAVSDGVAEDLRNRFGLRNVLSLPNSIDLDRIETMAREKMPPDFEILFEHPVLMSIGMLGFQKGHDVLLHAFARVRHAGYPHHLIIAGRGEDLEKLRELARQLNLMDSVHLIGYVYNPYPLLKRAALFVLSSRFEGFALVLAEAMALGIPVVSTDCDAGPREVLADGRCGVLVPVEDPEALAQGIIRVLGDDELAQTLRAAGLCEVRKRDVKLWSGKFVEAVVSASRRSGSGASGLVSST
jgi:glycosyltransferase involved in cell wall biosynthesis